MCECVCRKVGGEGGVCGAGGRVGFTKLNSLSFSRLIPQKLNFSSALSRLCLSAACKYSVPYESSLSTLGCLMGRVCV